jgi:hypothetical protein
MSQRGSLLPPFLSPSIARGAARFAVVAVVEREARGSRAPVEMLDPAQRRR